MAEDKEITLSTKTISFISTFIILLTAFVSLVSYSVGIEKDVGRIENDLGRIEQRFDRVETIIFDRTSDRYTRLDAEKDFEERDEEFLRLWSRLNTLEDKIDTISGRLE